MGLSDGSRSSRPVRENSSDEGTLPSRKVLIPGERREEGHASSWRLCSASDELSGNDGPSASVDQLAHRGRSSSKCCHVGPAGMSADDRSPRAFSLSGVGESGCMSMRAILGVRLEAWRDRHALVGGIDARGPILIDHEKGIDRAHRTDSPKIRVLLCSRQLNKNCTCRDEAECGPWEFAGEGRFYPAR